ncbi:MAG: glycerophosphodiester phosphodiesterase family protein [Clostridia bacterium]|nr:glycerophosphodiester phosphodiesterase family protein [Clostridia bacterium]
MNRDVSWLFEKPIAHRGACFGNIPENSMTAFREAIERGLVIELDIQCLRDGTIVVFHDFDTLRMTGRAGMLKYRNLESAKKLRLKGDGDERMPTLREVLDLVDGKVGLMIELKVIYSFKKLCDGLLKELEGYKGKVAIHGFSQRAIAYIAAHSDYPRGVVGMDYRKVALIGIYGHWLNRVAYFDRIDPDFLNYNLAHIPSPTTKRFKELGIPVMSWTIKNKKQFDNALTKSDNIVMETKFFDKDFTMRKFKEETTE